RLILSWYLIGAWTGRSAGFSRLRISLTTASGAFEAIGYKVPGLRHGQQVGPSAFRSDRARGFSALICEPSVLFWGLFVRIRFLFARCAYLADPSVRQAQTNLPQRLQTHLQSFSRLFAPPAVGLLIRDDDSTQRANTFERPVVNAI